MKTLASELKSLFEAEVFDGITSTEKDHYHSYSIDKDGNGFTDATFDADDNYLSDSHSHNITGGKLQDQKDHTHTLKEVDKDEV